MTRNVSPSTSSQLFANPVVTSYVKIILQEFGYRKQYKEQEQGTEEKKVEVEVVVKVQ